MFAISSALVKHRMVRGTVCIATGACEGEECFPIGIRAVLLL